MGWKAENPLPKDINKYIVIVVPHTSNWDFVYGFLSRKIINLKPGVIKFMAKSSLFKGMGGWFFHNAGGLPVYRDSKKNMIEQIADYYKKLDEIGVCITPEGTRGLAENWKTGFWYLGKATGAPVVLGYINYLTRRVGIGPEYKLTDDKEKDLEGIKKYYEQIIPRYPELSILNHHGQKPRIWPNRIASYFRLALVIGIFVLLIYGIKMVFAGF
jgi:1-acyl-sn-glycerol-3-phosphate acyltransferase